MRSNELSFTKKQVARETIINTLNRIQSSSISEKKAFQQLYEDLKEIEKDSPLEKYAMAYFNLKDWLQDKNYTIQYLLRPQVYSED